MLDSIKDAKHLIAKFEAQIYDKEEEMKKFPGKKGMRQRTALETEIAEIKKNVQYKTALKMVADEKEKEEKAAKASVPTQACPVRAKAEAPVPAEKEALKEAALVVPVVAAADKKAFDETAFQNAFDLASKTMGKKSDELLQVIRECTCQKAALAFICPKMKEMLKNKKEQGNAIPILEKLSEFSPLMLNLYTDMLALTHDAKLGKGLLQVCRSAVEKCSNKRCLNLFMPLVLGAIEKPPGNKWKVKVAALDILNTPLLMDMYKQCPKQLNSELAQVVKALVGCCKEIRAEIKDLGTKLLEKVGTMVKCAEIRNISDKICNCLVNFGNATLAQDTLYLIANTTFLSYVDAASFALLFPIVERAMKERQFESKKNGIMIVGAAVVLIEDPEILTPYLTNLLPILEDLALDPIFEIQREAAKAFGSLGKNLPDLCNNKILPWALEKMESRSGDEHQSETERTGSSHTCAELMNQCPHLLPRVLREVVLARMFDANGTNEARQGAFIFIEFMCKVDAFEPYVELVNMWLLKGICDSSKMVHERAFSAAQALINEYGNLKADFLTRPICDACFTFEDDTSSRDKSSKEMCMILFRYLVEKVSESRKYGQDMMTMDCCSLSTRLSMVCLLQMMRSDEDPAVRRQCNKVMGEQLDSISKTKKETRDTLLACVKDIVATCKNQNKLTIAKRCLTTQMEDPEVQKEFKWDQAVYDATDASKSVFEDYDWTQLSSYKQDILKNAEAKAKALYAEQHGGIAEDDVENKETMWTELAAILHGLLESTQLLAWTREEDYEDTFSKYVEGVVVSSTLEAITADQAFASICAEIVDLDEAHKKILKQQVLDKVFEHFHPKELLMANNPDILCHVENLMLMYGGGHLLLKDTTFELRKNHRYGVVGRNGTGKTTLMNLIATGGVPQIPDSMTCIHVKPEVLDHFMTVPCKKFMQMEAPQASTKELEEILHKVMFPENLWDVTIAELSGGWRMRLLIAGAMMKKADVLLLDEPTNHLDVNAVTWLADYLNGLKDSAIMVISHDPYFLNRVCTDIINYNKGKLVYYDGNFNAFTKKMGINAADADALLAGQVGVGENGVERDDDESSTQNPMDTSHSSNADEESSTGEMTPGETTPRTGSNTPKGGDAPDRKAKIVFPIPGKVKGLTSLAKPVLEISNLTYAYNEEKGDVINGVSAKITMNSRIHIKGVNGAGKSTFINLICGEVHPNASACPQKGSVDRHRNCRLAYMAQQHMHHMQPFMNSSPYIYLQKRFANGYDGALQERLMSPANEEEAEKRVALAKVHGKYGNMIKNLVGRQIRGKETWYEVSWENLEDTKQNTWTNMDGLQKLGCESFALAYDDRQASLDAGLDSRPLSQREIVKHLESFGITEELALNRTIGMFSAGQKSKVSLAAAFWCKPHLIALDEPTNYIDMETLDALTVALQRFKGGVVCISHAGEFVKKVCNETWMLEGGGLTITKGVNGN